VLVLVTDGGDNHSRRSISDAILEAQKSGAVVFAIDTVIRAVPTSQRGQKMENVEMEYLSELTGGELFTGVSGEEMPKVLASVRQSMDKMYYLTYAPTNTSSRGVHEVVVKPVPNTKLQLSYARKYFWNP
jgi:hypothetical protein